MKVIVVGAGIWGTMTALYLRESGAEVHLIDMWGPGNSRSGSGGESRIIRLGYGRDDIYIDMTKLSFELWANLEQKTGRKLLEETGMLWLFPNNNPSYIESAIPRINFHGYDIETLSIEAAKLRYLQFNLEDFQHIYFEKKAAIIYANQACKTAVDYFKKIDGNYEVGFVSVDEQNLGNPKGIQLNGSPLEADYFVFACGPWNKKLFPFFFQQNLQISRHEVFYFGVPNHLVKHYSAPALPIWSCIDPDSPMFYGMPFHLSKGMKIAYDIRTDPIDPDLDDRTPTPYWIDKSKSYFKYLFPDLTKTFITETRVCQYENSPDGHFIMDYHPQQSNILILAGSSGHGFKMGPAVGDLINRHLLEEAPLPEFFKVKRFTTELPYTSQFLGIA